MITRIEIDGFKSFKDFVLDLRPFTVVIGTNAGGKSNLVEALLFLSRLSGLPHADVHEAVDAVRGRTLMLFRQLGDGSRVEQMRFAVEMLLDFRPAYVFAGPGDGARMRYEVVIGFEGRRLKVLRQSITGIDPDEDRWFDLVGASEEWRAALERATDAAPDSWDFTSVRAADPLRNLRFLDLHDRSLREPSDAEGRDVLDPSGGGLAGYLAAIGQDQELDDVSGAAVLAAVRADLGMIVRDIVDFRVVEDQARRELWVEFTARDQPPFPADVASDGTLRALALLASIHDPRPWSGPLVLEEPENGLYPERFRDLLAAARAATSDPAGDRPGDPLRQVVVTSHSPVVLDVVPSEAIVFLDAVQVVGPLGSQRVSRARRLLAPGERMVSGDIGHVVPARELAAFRAGRQGALS